MAYGPNLLSLPNELLDVIVSSLPQLSRYHTSLATRRLNQIAVPFLQETIEVKSHRAVVALREWLADNPGKSKLVKTVSFEIGATGWKGDHLKCVDTLSLLPGVQKMSFDIVSGETRAFRQTLLQAQTPGPHQLLSNLQECVLRNYPTDRDGFPHFGDLGMVLGIPTLQSLTLWDFGIRGRPDLPSDSFNTLPPLRCLRLLDTAIEDLDGLLSVRAMKKLVISNKDRYRPGGDDDVNPSLCDWSKAIETSAQHLESLELFECRFFQVDDQLDLHNLRELRHVYTDNICYFFDIPFVGFWEDKTDEAGDTAMPVSGLSNGLPPNLEVLNLNSGPDLYIEDFEREMCAVLRNKEWLVPKLREIIYGDERRLSVIPFKLIALCEEKGVALREEERLI